MLIDSALFEMLEKRRNFAVLYQTNHQKDMTYHLLRFLLKMISHIPFSVLYAFSGGMYFLLYHVAGYRRKTVRKNLSESFPEKDGKELKAIEKNFYRFLTDNILEICKMGAMSAREMGRRMNFTNIDAVNEVLRGGRSVALYLGHLGNWEWISSMPLHLYDKAVSAQIYHKLSNDDFDRIMLENRASHGATNVEMRKTARFVNEQAMKGQVCIIGFIADQSPRKKDATHYLRFLNHEVPALTGTEKIIKHYDFDVWFVQPKRVKRGYYEAEFVHITDEPRQLPDFQLTDIYFNMLDQAIRRQPELYLWTHKRFRYARPSDRDVQPLPTADKPRP